jgi:hypothetical protein
MSFSWRALARAPKKTWQLEGRRLEGTCLLFPLQHLTFVEIWGRPLGYKTSEMVELTAYKAGSVMRHLLKNYL